MTRARRASENVEEKKEAPAEVKEGEVQEFGILSDAIKPACFSRGERTSLNTREVWMLRRGCGDPVSRLILEVPAKEDEDDVEAKEQSRADELVPNER